MKRILIIMFVLTDLVCLSQAQISMSPSYYISPNDSVNFGDSVHITVYIKNTGNATFSGGMTVQAKRDTTFGVSCGSSSLSVSGFQPGDSISTVITFTPSGGTFGFKVAGNGNTIVVWPIVTGVFTGDSVRPILWINEPNGIREMTEHPFQIFPNPATNQINIKSSLLLKHGKLIIYDVFARKVEESLLKEVHDVSDLEPGSYWLIITTETESYRIPFIKE